MAVVLALACDAPTTGSGAVPVPLLGTWDYSAVQTSPATAALTGTLEVTGQAGPDFEGTLEATETDGQGGVRQLAGSVTGRALDPTTVDFDAFFSLTGRRHLGTVSDGTIRGAWVEAEPGGQTRSGSFEAVWRAPP